MLGKVKVLTQPEYESWLVEKANASGGGGMSLVQWGEKLYTEKTCFTCHSKDGSQIIGPTFKGLYGRQEKFLDGSTLKVDENYIRESIVNPTAKVVVGFPPVMPAFQGLLKEREIDALIEYIKTLK
jgi:cytochrome c oxidase subunit 2